ncbi:MAG TPA: hypothetical protein VF588_07280 [Pyrinomonadaceae bacterium]|jgi:hypothetical protein
MKKVRIFASLLLLGVVLAVGYSPSAVALQFGVEGCGRCNCYTPNTKLYGVKQAAGDSCPSCDCYTDVMLNE